MCTLFLPPGDNPIAFNKYINISINFQDLSSSLFFQNAKSYGSFNSNVDSFLYGSEIQSITLRGEINVCFKVKC